MKASIKWVQDAEFVGESGSGHSIVMDGPPDFGGQNRGVRPGTGGHSRVPTLVRETASRLNTTKVTVQRPFISSQAE